MRYLLHSSAPNEVTTVLLLCLTLLSDDMRIQAVQKRFTSACNITCSVRQKRCKKVEASGWDGKRHAECTLCPTKVAACVGAGLCHSVIHHDRRCSR